MSQNSGNKRLVLRGLAVASALAILLGAFITAAWAKDVPSGYPPKSPFGPPPPGPFPPARLSPDLPWCRYPVRSTVPTSGKTAIQNKRVVKLDEVEPNETATTAQFVSISSTIGSEIDITVKGSISEGADVDYYRIFVNKGDVLGLVATTNRDMYDMYPDVGLDTVLAICYLNEDVMVANDDDRGLSALYPPESPLPRIETPLIPSYRWDSVLSWIAPETGDYLVRVTSFESSRRGDYELKIVARRPSFESQAVGATQIIFLDFDGVTNFNAVQTFGLGWYLTELTPMRYFLPGWGLTLADEAAVVDAIVGTFQERFDNIRDAALNGDRDTDFVDGRMDVEIRNSRDHVDPWGQPNVTRIIIGGSMYDLGIPTLGIAESIDPGNFGREETAVVLLDYLSDPDPANLDSINAMPRSPDFTMVDAVGRVVGVIAAHEAAHTLGLWHTDNSNATACLIDTGGNGIADEAGVGPDGIMGTADDELPEMVPDMYDPFEGVATEGFEFTNTRVAFGTSTGTSASVPPPPTPDPNQPAVSISVMPKVGQAPVTMSFAGGGVDPTGGKFIVFNWSFGDGGTATGAYVTHTYTQAGSYIVTLTGVTDSAVIAQAAAEVTVTSEPNQKPVAEITATPKKGDAPLLVVFEAQASDEDGTVIGYSWDFGDGQSGVGPSIDHVYVTPGVYVATLTVADNLGATQQDTATITVLGESATGGTSGNQDATNDSGLPIPALGNCGAGAPAAMLAALAGMLGMALMRRRH